MNRFARKRPTSHRATSACEVIEIRRVTSRPPPPSAPSTEAEEPATVRMTLVDPPPASTGVDGDDATRVERLREDSVAMDVPLLTSERLAELKRILREAEAREELEAEESSGIRLRPTPPEGVQEDWEPTDDALDDLDIAFEPPLTMGEWTGMGDALPELEVALAPRSESNFYGGFDDLPQGVFVATHRDLAVDAPVYVAVHLPAGYRFRTPALVEFVREPDAATPDAPAGIGLRLCGLDADMERLIGEFVKQRPPLFYIG